MKRGVKTVNTVRKSFPQKVLRIVINARLLSHLPYSVVVFHAIEQNLTASSEKQLN